MSYGVDVVDAFQQGASYVSRILRGESVRTRLIYQFRCLPIRNRSESQDCQSAWPDYSALTAGGC
jgi:hypothetical protein